MAKSLTKKLRVLISVVLIFQLVGCGTILYPERKGQKGGRIDPGVAILDAVGLLFFVIPGVIAFAVDFSNGTIYLPGTSHSSLDREGLRQVKFDPEHAGMAHIEKIIKEETGYDVKLEQDSMRISKLNSVDDMMVHFKEVLPEIKNTRVALSVK